MEIKKLEGRIQHQFDIDANVLKTKEGTLHTLPPMIDDMIKEPKKHCIKIVIIVEQSYVL